MKIKKAKQSWQQGDVIGRKLCEMPVGEHKVLGRKRVVLAHGESGHSHVVEEDEAELIEIGGRMLLNLTKEATVKHEEHKPIKLEPGIWEIGRVKEYDYFQQMSRNVRD
jgi:hypothetical protein